MGDLQPKELYGQDLMTCFPLQEVGSFLGSFIEMTSTHVSAMIRSSKGDGVPTALTVKSDEKSGL